VIPAQGLIEIRDTLTDLLKEYGTDDKGEMCFFLMKNCAVYLIAYLMFVQSLCNNSGCLQLWKTWKTQGILSLENSGNFKFTLGIFVSVIMGVKFCA